MKFSNSLKILLFLIFAFGCNSFGKSIVGLDPIAKCNGVFKFAITNYIANFFGIITGDMNSIKDPLDLDLFLVIGKHNLARLSLVPHASRTEDQLYYNDVILKRGVVLSDTNIDKINISFKFFHEMDQLESLNFTAISYDIMIRKVSLELEYVGTFYWILNSGFKKPFFAIKLPNTQIQECH